MPSWEIASEDLSLDVSIDEDRFQKISLNDKSCTTSPALPSILPIAKAKQAGVNAARIRLAKETQ